MKTFFTISIFACSGLLMLFLSACGPSDSLKAEAYRAGREVSKNERCRDIKPPLMVPSRYDDSSGSGELVSQFRAGMYAAKNDSTLCN